MKTEKLYKITIVLVLVLALCWGVYELFSNLAISFSMMLIVAAVSIVAIFNKHQKLIDEEDNTKIIRYFRTMVLINGIVAAIAMCYYFYPPAKVYTNNDHHAFVLEGIKTDSSAMLLAANDKRAFFDDEDMAGSISLTGIDNNKSTAKLNIKNAGMPVYYMTDDRWGSNATEKFYELVKGQNNLHSFMAEEGVELINDKNVAVAKIRVEYIKKRRPRARYIIEYQNAKKEQLCDTSAFDGIITKSYPLSKLFPNLDTINGVCLTRIELMRGKTAVLKTDSKYYKYVLKEPFIVGYDKDSGLSALRSGKKTTKTNSQAAIDISLKSNIYKIGLSNRIPDFSLKSESSGFMTLRYRMPQYRYLNVRKDDEDVNDFHTFMVASTIISEKGDLNVNLPENILLYDVFDHVDNMYQMDPMFFSFHPDNTQVPLALTIVGNDKLYYAGDSIPDIATASPKASWIVSLDNFKNPSQKRPYGIARPKSARNMLIVIAILTLLFYFLLSINNVYGITYIEPIVYVMIISIMAIRLTLIWRASVFPPVDGISINEFNGWHFTNEVLSAKVLLKNMTFLGLILLVVSVFFMKRYGYYVTRLVYQVLKKHNPEYSILKAGKKPSQPKEKTFIRKISTRIKTNLIRYYDLLSCTDNQSAEPETKYSVYRRLFPQNTKKSRRLLWLHFAMYPILFAVSYGLGKPPLFCVGLPVLWYFIVDFVISHQIPLHNEKGVGYNKSHAYFWLGLVNMTLATGVMFVLDGGYGALFFIFSLMSMILRLSDLYGVDPYDKEKHEGVHFWGVVATSFFIVFIITFIRSIIVGLFTGGYSVLVVCTIGLAIFIGLLMWTIGRMERVKIRNLVTIGVICCLFAGGVIVGRHYAANTHIFNRVMVLSDGPSKILGGATNKTNVTKFLEASLNDWVIEEYEERGREINPVIGEKGYGYFKIQPHSNVGVSWMTQLTDISVSRLVISEHSGNVPIFLILIFLLMLGVSLVFPSNRRWTKNLLTQIPLLFMVQSLFVWMAVTRRFIFIGQDFPMLSVFSRVNVVMSFIGFATWIVIAIYETIAMKCDEEFRGIRYNEGITEFYRRMNNWEFPFFTLAVIIIVLFGHATKNIDDGERNVYDVQDCMNATWRLIADPEPDESPLGNISESIETLFAQYQDTLIYEKNKNIKDKKKKVLDISKFGTPHTLMVQFCEYYGYNTECDFADTNIIARIFAADENYGKFARHVFDEFVTKKSYKNDVNGLVYLIKTRCFKEGDEKESVRYSFEITSKYYKQHLPSRIANNWQGNVIGSASIVVDKPARFNEKGMQVYVLPKEWVKDCNMAVIVKPNDNDAYTVVGQYEPYKLAKNASYYLGASEMLIGAKAVNMTKYGVGNYIARYALINSHPQFIYPLQSQFYWARPFADQVRMHMNAEMQGQSRRKYNKLRKEDVVVTLSTSMTMNLYKAIDGTAPRANVAVVVADGDGRVLALVDHKRAGTKLNPNDARRIQKVEDSLKQQGMLNRGKIGEQFFGNRAILALPNGPGSSQKPIVWTAVTSQYKGLDWGSMQIEAIQSPYVGHEMLGGLPYFRMWSFAKNRINKRVEDGSKVKRSLFRSLQGDEGAGADPITLRSYMYKSSNYYNALMVVIGSYSREQLKDFKSIMQPFNNDYNNNEYYCDSLFPVVSIKGTKYSFAKPLTNDNIENPNSVLIQGLTNNFAMHIDYNKVRNTDLHPTMMASEKRKSNVYYALPQAPYFNNKMRHYFNNKYDIGRDGVKSTAIGNNTIWMVSPLKMAEMYGRMISLNKNYSLTLDPNYEKPKFAQFDVDGSINDYIKMRHGKKDRNGNYNGFITGLNEVFTLSGEGTARGVYFGAHGIKNKLDGYYIYGKTGTIDGKLRNADGVWSEEQDHLLAVVITNKRLEELNDIDDYKDLKFVVVYIADYNYKHVGNWDWYKTDAAIINTILDSEEFKNYMNGGNNGKKK